MEPSDPASIRVRPALPAEAEAIAALAARSFREAWQAYNTPADMDAYCLEHFVPARIAADLREPAVRYLLADLDGALPGYLRLVAGSLNDSVAARRPLEISRLYVCRDWHGRGVGPALMQAGLLHAARAGHDVAWLAVWQRAAQALAFYRKWGFEVTGSASFLLGADLQDDYVMRRALDDYRGR